MLDAQSFVTVANVAQCHVATCRSPDWQFGEHHENIQSHHLFPPLLAFRAAFKLTVFNTQRHTIQYFLSFHTSPLLSLFVWDERCVCHCVLCASMRSYVHVRMRACLSNLIFPFVCVWSGREGMCLFSPRPSSVQPQQGLSRARIKGPREEERVPPQLIWPLWGEEHYSHWCSGRMAKTPRSFRKGAYSGLDVTCRTGLEDGCWAHCGDGGNIVPALLL